MQIKSIIIIGLIGSTLLIFAPQYAPFIIVLDPAGDAKYAGRKIEDAFERGITLQCVEKMKTIIENYYPTCIVFITRIPGDMLYELQNAVFANHRNAHLFMSINFYYT